VSSKAAARAIEERERLLVLEAGLQRAALAASFAKWEDKKLLAIGSTLITWGWKLLAVPRVRWLVAAALLSKLRKRHKH